MGAKENHGSHGGATADTRVAGIRHVRCVRPSGDGRRTPGG